MKFRITKRELIKLLIIISLWAGFGAYKLLGCIWKDIINRDERPNIVFIILDAWRYDHFTPEITPNIWELAKKGIRFENFFVNAGYTRASMASIFSGRLPKFEKGDEAWKAIGFKHLYPAPIKPWVTAEGVEKIPPNLETFPEILRGVGYYTIAVIQNRCVGSWMGYDHRQWKALIEFPITENKIGADTLVKAATDKLNQEREYFKKQPYLLYLHFIDSHQPYNRLFLDKDAIDRANEYFGTVEDKKYEEEFGKESVYYVVQQVRERLLPEMKHNYKEALRFLDKQVARLIYEIGDIDKTIYIITADHGEMFDV